MSKKSSVLKDWDRINVPTKNELAYVLDQYVSLGVISPEDVPLLTQDPSTLESFLEDPEVVASQLQSMKKMEQLGEGKLTDVDRANMAQQMQMEAQQERANREAILSNARSRGVAGSGLEMAAQLQGEQEAANRASRAATDVNVAAQNRGIQALSQAGQMAGNIRSQEMDVAARKAAAQDAINQFNTANAQSIARTNVEAKNAAQAANLANAQRIAEANVNQTNEQRRIAADAAEQAFQNKISQISGKSGLASSIDADKAQSNASKKAQTGQLLMGAASIAAEIFSDERVKDDIEEWNPSDFLDKIVPVKYKYKDEMAALGENPSIEHKGVIAQDVEKGAPELVKEVGGVKAIDIRESIPMILAALGDINKRLKKVEK